jgi:light-regulated signal transduction histidine kinase (bacteriophytochrome)
MLFVVRPEHVWWSATPHNLAVFGTYLVGALTIVVITCAMQRARQRAIHRQIELEREMGERIQAEEALRKAHDELELRIQERTAELARSNAELQQFAYVASHDLQEPLRMVSNFTQLLAERYDAKLDNDGREFIAYAVEGATRMQTLVQDLLSLSRVGTRGRNLEVVRLDEAADRAVANLEFAIQETGASVTHDELPEVMADSSQMMQLFQNLIGNGIKFKGAEPPGVHVSAIRNDKEWTFSVRDNGIGFEPQYAERIFAVFQRLHSRDEYQGNGIGLAICRKIVERHQGRIWAESTPGSGTTFYFTMPAAGVPEVRPEQGDAA